MMMVRMEISAVAMAYIVPMQTHKKLSAYDFIYIAKLQTKSGQVFLMNPKDKIALNVKMSNAHTVTSSNTVTKN